MDTKKSIVLASALLLAAMAGLLAIAGEAKPVQNKLTPEERAERRYRRNGGEITKPIVGNYAAVINPGVVETGDIDKAIASIRELLTFPFKQFASEAECDNKAVMKILLVSEDAQDVLTIFPERPGAKINIRPLKADAADDALFLSRFKKEMWRAFAYALGAGNSASMFVSVMKPVTAVKDLDHLKVENAAPDGFNQMLEMAKKIKLERQEVYTYRQACMEGWAPAPTNDVQKAIWDKFNPIPDKPLTIEFDPAKGK